MSSTVIQQTPSRSSWRRAQAWLPTFLWLCVIASFSTDVFSAEHTGGILRKLLYLLGSSITDEQFRALHFLIRKTAHFTVYGLLGVFAFFSWRATLPAARWTLRWSGLSLLLVLAAAILDEFHQSFIPSRTSSPRDVALDLVGALCFQIIIATFLGGRRGQGVATP